MVLSKSAVGTRHWNEKIRPRILRRDDFTCFYCGQYATTVDHVIPRRLQGTDHDDNLVAACRKCNFSKGGRFFERSGTPPTPPAFSNPQNTSISHDPTQSNPS
jgi:5-methylcytosine-specific restriction endonuclease McrA